MAKSSHVIKRISGCTWYCSSRSETSVFPPCSSNKKRQTVQVLGCDCLFFYKRVVRRQHNFIFILLQQNCVELWKSGKPQKAAVHPAFIDPRRKARIRAVRGNFKKKQTCNPLQSSVSDCGFERRKTFAVEMDAPTRSSDIQRSFLSGGAGGIRTHGTVAGTPDFESFKVHAT